MKTIKITTSLCQQICKKATWSNDRKKSIYIQIPKMVNLKDFSNFRSITQYILPSIVHSCAQEIRVLYRETVTTEQDSEKNGKTIELILDG